MECRVGIRCRCHLHTMLCLVIWFQFSSGKWIAKDEARANKMGLELMNAHHKALRRKRLINAPSVPGLLTSVLEGDEWKRIPHRSKVRSELWLFVFLCLKYGCLLAC